jgi:hypothetical protein
LAANFSYGSDFSFSGLNAPFSSLIGVFVDSTHTYGAPLSLDFWTIEGRSFSILSPRIQQLFFIGDGLTGTGTGERQQFRIPQGADILYLSTFDVGSTNNVGSLHVNIPNANPVPESPFLALLGIGLVGVIAYGWRHRKQ